MARPRIHASELARLLNSADQPIYVLDDELTVIFVNRACYNWLGPPGAELLGSRAAYHSEPDVTGPEAVAAALCPPPQSTAGAEVSANVSCVGADGQVRRRRARFIPLGTCPEDQLAVIAVLDSVDLPEDQPQNVPSSHEADSMELHERIERFRREAAGRYRAEELLGNCSAIRLAKRQVELAADSRTNVLLVGPPGSGRRHIAAAVHYAGKAARSGSLTPLDCSVLGAELIGSTITALAGGNVLGDESFAGTLLLNHVDQLSADVQAELVAYLVNRPFPLRLIATAEQSLVELAHQGKYREELASVLSTITIGLPPLAERREDVPLLAQQCLEELNAGGTRQIGGFTPEALDLLHAYSWPGNVDELSQTVAEAHRRSAGPLIGADDLPERIHLAIDAAARPPHKEETIVLDEFLGQVERELIRRAMARSKGNKAKAARLLGMTRPRLYRRLVQLGLVEA